MSYPNSGLRGARVGIDRGGGGDTRASFTVCQRRIYHTRQHYQERQRASICRAATNLAVPTANFAALVADAQPPAATQAAAFQNRAPIFGGHTVKKAMLTTTGNSFWLPSSLRHCIPRACTYRHDAGIMRIQDVLLSVPAAGKTHCAPLYKGTEWAVKCAGGFTKAQACMLALHTVEPRPVDAGCTRQPRLTPLPPNALTRRRSSAARCGGWRRAGVACSDRQNRPRLPLRFGACGRACPRHRRTSTASPRSSRRP